MVTSLATILSGALLFWQGSDGLDLNWITSDPGVILTIGSVQGIIALGILCMFIIQEGHVEMVMEQDGQEVHLAVREAG